MKSFVLFVLMVIAYAGVVYLDNHATFDIEPLLKLTLP